MQILPLCYLHFVAASHSYTCAQDNLDTVQLALVVFFLPSTSANTLLVLMVVIVHCNCAGGRALAYSLMCTQMQLALCDGFRTH